MCKIVKIENKVLLQKFKDYISSINIKSNVAIVHHTDADGMSSGTITKISLERLNIIPKLVLPTSKRKMTKELIELLNEYKITHLIITDLPGESFQDIEKIPQIKVLVIDHHPVEKEIIPENILVIKPNLFQSQLQTFNMCATHICYLFFSEIINITDLDWIASLGMIGDICYESQKEFIDQVLRKNNIDIKPDVYDTEFGTLVNYITYADATKEEESYKKVLDALSTSNNYKEALQKLNEFKHIENTVKKYIENFQKDVEKINENLYFYEIDSPYDLGSMISTVISIKQIPRSSLFVLNKHFENKLRISARCQSGNQDMGKIMFKAQSLFENSNGGGHKPAAGGTIQQKDEKKFKEFVINEITKEKGDDSE